MTNIGAGAPTILTKEEEKGIVVSLQVLQEMGFGLTKKLVGIVIRDYLNDQPGRPNPFSSGVPGEDWWQRFLKGWHSKLSIRKPQHLPTHRALSATPEVMDGWFKRVQQLFDEAKLSALSTDELKCYLWNCDETGFCMAMTTKKILAKCGDKNVHETVGGSGRDYITILGAGCADGTRLPPFVVYKGKNLWSRWMKGGSAGCMYSVSDSGWMEAANFIQWFEKLFLPAVEHMAKKLPVVLFFDGHHSHLSLKLIELARTHNVHLFCFPPHCTHVLQPLDVAVFGPVKAAWWKVLKQHQMETCAASIIKEDFPLLLSKLWDSSFKPWHLVSGFYRCGLCPVSREAIPTHKLSTALPHTKPPVEPPPTITVEITGKCTIGDSVTPIRLHLRGYFSSLLQKKQATKSPSS